jgi:hypothetical protein
MGAIPVSVAVQQTGNNGLYLQPSNRYTHSSWHYPSSQQRHIAKPSGEMNPSDTLSAWIKSKGGYVHPKLDLCAELPNGDRGVVAKEAIAAGEQLALIPVEATIHVPSSQEAEE